MSDPDDPETDGEPRPEMPSAVDRRSLEKRKAKARRNEREAEEFWTRILDDPIGRRELWDFLDGRLFGINAAFATPTGMPHEQAAWFNAGRVAAAERQFRVLARLAPEGAFLMLREYDAGISRPKQR